MAIKKESAIDVFEVLKTGEIQVRRADRVFKDGKKISETYHRHVLSPGDDLSGEDPKVRKQAELEWTPEVVAAYQASKEE